MKAASVGIEAPAKGKIRAFVVTEDCLGCFLKNVRGDGRRRAEKFPEFRDKRVGRVGNRPHRGLLNLKAAVEREKAVQAIDGIGNVQIAWSPFG